MITPRFTSDQAEAIREILSRFLAGNWTTIVVGETIAEQARLASALTQKLKAIPGAQRALLDAFAADVWHGIARLPAPRSHDNPPCAAEAVVDA